jgi:hypothetical protein
MNGKFIHVLKNYARKEYGDVGLKLNTALFLHNLRSDRIALPPGKALFNHSDDSINSRGGCTEETAKTKVPDTAWNGTLVAKLVVSHFTGFFV